MANNNIKILIIKDDLKKALKQIKNFNNKIENIIIANYNKTLKIFAHNLDNYVLVTLIKNLNDCDVVNNFFISVNYDIFLSALNYDENNLNCILDIELLSNNYYSLMINNLFIKCDILLNEKSSWQINAINYLDQIEYRDIIYLDKNTIDTIKKNIIPFTCKDKGKLRAYKALDGILFDSKKNEQEILACDMVRLALFKRNAYQCVEEPLVVPIDLFKLLFKEKINKAKIKVSHEYFSLINCNAIFYYKMYEDDYPIVNNKDAILNLYKTYGNYFLIPCVYDFIKLLSLIKNYFTEEHYINLKIMKSKLEISIDDNINKWEYSIKNVVLDNYEFKDTIIRVDCDLFINTLKTFNKKETVNILYNNAEEPLFFTDLENNILKLQLPLKSKE